MSKLQFAPARTVLNKQWSRLFLVALGVVLLAVPWGVTSPVFLDVMVLIFIYGLFGVAWNLMGGYTGQISFGHAIYFGFGAYAPMLMYTRLHLSPWLGVAAGMIVSGIFSLLLGWPVFRLSGHYYAIATIAAGEIVEIAMTNWPWVGASNGIQAPILASSLANFQWQSKLPYYYLCLAFLAGGLTFTSWLLQLRPGYYFMAIREDADAAQALGINVFYYKQVAAVCSAMMASLAGTLYAQYILYVDPSSTMGLSLSVQAVLVTMLGGAGMLFGPVIGAAVLIPLQELSQIFFSGSGSGLNLIIYGVLVMALAAYQPDGLIGVWHALRNRYLNGGAPPVRKDVTA